MPTVTSVATSITAFVGRARSGPVNIATPVRGWAEFSEIFGGLWPPGPASYAIRQYFANGGREAIFVRVSAGVAVADSNSGAPDRGPVSDAEIVGDRAARTGLFALDALDSFDLLCIPPPDWNRDHPLATWAAGAQYCSERRAMLLVDAPAAWSADPTPAAAKARMAELGAALGRAAGNAAVYFPRLRAADPLAGNALRDLAPCGAVAGIIARTDAARGVWKSPAGAGAPLVGVVGPTLDLSEEDLARFNSFGLNCLRTLPRAGTVVWGARTAGTAVASEAEWKYIPVRRLFLYLERSIDRGTNWVAFEPNGEALWEKVRLKVEDFLLGLFRAGAFAGAKPEEAWFVKCDRTTMTPSDIDSGRLVIEVGFAPAKPAEFVMLRIFKQTAQTAEARQ